MMAPAMSAFGLAGKRVDGGEAAYFMVSGFWIFLLEGALALGLLVFIVWWTLPKQNRNKRPEDRHSQFRPYV